MSNPQAASRKCLCKTSEILYKNPQSIKMKNLWTPVPMDTSTKPLP